MEEKKMQNEQSQEEVLTAQAQPPKKNDAKKKPLSTQALMTLIAVAVLVVAVAIGTVAAVNYYRTGAGSAGKVEGHSEAAQVVTGESATEAAQVKNADAIEVIRGYSDEALGIKKEDYSLMVAQQAYVIRGEEYVQVIAAEKAQNEDGTFSITPVGKYYISFDGKTVLKEDMQNPGVYEKLKK